MKKKTLVVIILIFIVTNCLTIMAKNTQNWQMNQNFTVDNVDGTDVYSATADGSSVIELKSDFSGYNTLEADVYYNKIYGEEGYLSFQINTSSNYYLFDISPNIPENPVSRVLLGDNVKSRVELASGRYGNCNAKNWIHLKITLESNYIMCYVNGKKIHSLNETIDGGIWTRALIAGWRCDMKVKNLIASYEEIKPEKPSTFIIPTEWEKSIVNEEDIYTRVGNGTITSNGTTLSGNTLKMDMKVSEIYYEQSSTTSIEYVLSSGKKYAIVYDKAQDSISITKDGATIASEEYLLDLDTWEKYSFIFDTNFIAVYSGDDYGKIIISSYNTLEDDFSNGYFNIYGWNVKTSVKNLSVSSQTVDPSDIGYLDLSFNSAASINAFSCTNGEISYTQGSLKYTINGENSIFETPHIEVSKGDKYSALLEVRNTIDVRMKNNSDATKIKVYFITSEDESYSETKSLTFDIEAYSEFQMYYFNLSQNKYAKGYLRGFKIDFLDTTEGTVLIDDISFSREDAYYSYLGSITKCSADKNTNKVIVEGTVPQIYDGKIVKIYDTPVENYLDSLDYKGLIEVAEGQVIDGKFSIDFNFKVGEMTRISSFFIAGIDGVKIDKRFKISNYTDFTKNPYSFDLNSLSVDVTNSIFGAKGDSYTNDTKAIQNAINYVNENGGGRVYIPGDSSKYGKRYVITGLKLLDNVELFIDDNAILWQSNRYSDYTDYTLYFGHENMGGSTAWGLSALMHLPLIYIKDCSNVKVSGGGTIRMDDTGGECLDGNNYAWNSNITVGCGNIVHLVPIGIYGSDHVEISDIKIIRSNCWHAYIRESSEIYFGNVDMYEVNCINGDGLDFSTAVHNVMVNRCSLYSNDDALVLAVTTNDPRDDLSIWREKSQKADKSLYNFEVVGSNLFGGHGITFIPWASDCSKADTVEIYNINVHDCILGGTSTSVGAWADNPFYGTSNYFLGTYGSTDSAEDGDYSPIRDITILNNTYKDTCSFYGIHVTNLVTDANMKGATNFENGTFDKIIRLQGEDSFTVGTSYWSRSGNVGTKKIGTNYCGYVEGVGYLAQGIFLREGNYSFDCDYKGSNAEFFVIDSLTNKEIYKKNISDNSEFNKINCSFVVSSKGEYLIGIRNTGEEMIYLDNANVSINNDSTYYNLDEEKTNIALNSIDDLEKFNIYSDRVNYKIYNDKLLVSADNEYKFILNNSGILDSYIIEVTISPYIENGAINSGVYVFARNPYNSSDKISALNVEIEKEANKNSYKIKLFKFDSNNGFEGVILESQSIDYSNSCVKLKVVVKNSTLYIFSDDNNSVIFDYDVENIQNGQVGLRSQKCNTYFSDFSIVSDDYTVPVGNRQELNYFYDVAIKFNENDFSQSSYNNLTLALNKAKNLDDNATQKEVDLVKDELKTAISNLVIQKHDVKTYDDIQGLINVANKYNKANYTEETFDNMKAKVNSAKELTRTSSNEEIIKAYDELIDSINNLEVIDEANVKSSDGNIVYVVVIIILSITTFSSLTLCILFNKKMKKN